MRHHKRIAWILAIAFIAMIVLANLLLPKFFIPSQEKIAEGYLKYTLPAWAKGIYERIAKDDPDNVDLQRGLILSYFKHLESEEDKKRSRDSIRNEIKKLLENYKLRVAQNPQDAVGWWSIGYIYFQDKNYEEALRAFKTAHQYNPHLKYLNNAIGLTLAEKDFWPEAKGYFEKEIKHAGAIELAIPNLVKSAIRFRDIATLKDITHASYFGKVPYHLKNNSFYLLGDIIGYAKTSFFEQFEKLDAFALIAATIIGMFWFVYFSRFDIFERDPLISRIAIFLLGIASAVMVGIWYDFFIFNLNFNLTGTFTNNLIFSIFVIGLGEELVKIIPFILFWKFTKRIDNSYDAILFAGLSGLGFASIENYSYFASRGDLMFVGRFLTASILHFTLSGILGYHIYEAARRRSFRILLRGVLIAVGGHGVYDFLLIGPRLGILAFAILFLSISDLMKAVERSLKIRRIKKEKCEVPLHLLPSPFYLYLTYFLLLALVYIDAALTYSPKVANAGLLLLCFFTIMLAFYIASSVNSENLNLEKFYGISNRRNIA